MDTEIGRNDVCSCGSGKKYKKCCGKTKAQLVQRRREGLKSRQIVNATTTPLKAFASKVFKVLTDTATTATSGESLANKIQKRGTNQETPRSYNSLEELLEMENRSKKENDKQDLQ
jgi:hypothetical protein